MKENLLSYLKNLDLSKPIFSIEDILKASKDIGVQECYKLIKQSIDDDILYCYSQGKYKLNKGKKKFNYYYSPVKPIKYDELFKNMMFDICYFNTSSLNELTSLQKINNPTIIFVEGKTEKYFLDQLYKNDIKAISTDDYYHLKKSYRGIDFDFDYLVKKMSVDTPIEHDDYLNRCMLTIEGVLVDLLSDKYFKNVYASEITNIYKESLSRYTIKIDKLMRYATKKHIQDTVKDLFDYINFDITTGEFV